jgi:hypothetical protein
MSSNVAEKMSEERDRGTSFGSSEQAEAVDIPRLMADIRKRVRADLAATPEGSKPFKNYVANQNKSGARRAGELVHSEELHYLNTHWQYGTPPDLSKIVSHRPGFIGRIVVGVKRRILALFSEHFLKEYFYAEREYQMRLVQLLNSLTSYVDDRDSAAFWELVRKIDYDVSKSLNRIETIADEQRAPREQPRHGLRGRHVLVDGLRAMAQDGLGAVQGGGHRAGSGGRRSAWRVGVVVIPRERAGSTRSSRVLSIPTVFGYGPQHRSGCPC